MAALDQAASKGAGRLYSGFTAELLVWPEAFLPGSGGVKVQLRLVLQALCQCILG